MADSTRALQSQRLLSTLSEESKQAEAKLKTSRQAYSTLSTEISALESKLAALQLELSKKNALVKAAKEEMDD